MISEEDCCNSLMEVHLDITLHYLNQWDQTIKDTEVVNI
jgi:hypothetical protein